MVMNVELDFTKTSMVTAANVVSVQQVTRKRKAAKIIHSERYVLFPKGYILFLKGLSMQDLESHFIICDDEFEGADHEAAIYFCLYCIVSNL